MIFVTHFTAVPNVQFLHNHENCTGIRKLLSFISGNVLQRNPPMVKKMPGPSSFPGSLRRGDQNGGQGVQLSAILNHPAAKTLETRFCNDAIGYRRFEIRAGDVRGLSSFFPFSDDQGFIRRCLGIERVKWQ